MLYFLPEDCLQTISPHITAMLPQAHCDTNKHAHTCICKNPLDFISTMIPAYRFLPFVSCSAVETFSCCPPAPPHPAHPPPPPCPPHLKTELGPQGTYEMRINDAIFSSAATSFTVHLTIVR